MTVFALASTHASPGVTTTVMGLAASWQEAAGRDVLVVEADPDGGMLATWFDELRADRTLTDVAVDVRRSFELDAVLASARPVWGGLPVVVAPPSAEHTHSALTASGDRLAAGLAALAELDVLVDLGRLTARSPALHLARRAVVTLLVTRPTFAAVASLAARIPELTAQGVKPAIVLVGDQPYSAAETERALGIPVAAVLPHDPRTAAALAGGPARDRQLRRSLLWRTIRDLASRLAQHVPTADPSLAVPAGTNGHGPPTLPAAEAAP